MNTIDKDRLTAALEHAKSGNAILFLGAGFSTGAKNRLGEGIPLASALKKTMASIAECDSELPLETIAEYFMEAQSPSEYLRFFESHLRCSEVSEWIREIAKVPWLRVYTTNYDDVYEFASRAEHIDVKTVKTTDSVADSKISITQVVHINGSIEGLGFDTIGDLRLTHSSFAADSFLQNPWVEVFRSDLATARAVIFCGYSLVDIDIRKLIVENEALKRKLNLIVYPGESRPILRTLEKYGVVFPIGVDGLGMALKRTAATANSSPQFVFGSFEKPSVYSPAGSKLTDRDVFSLFCYGTIDQSHVWRHQRKVVSDPLLIDRHYLSKAVSALTESTDDVVIHGHLATGKSMLLDQIAATDFGPNWEVFRLKSEGFRWREEVRKICDSKGRTIVLIDNYPQRMEVVKEFSLHRGKLLSLVLAARTNEFDVTLTETEANLRDYIDIDINFLTRQEAASLAAIFKHYGYLGELAGTRDGSAVEAIERNTRLQMHSILLWIFNSDAVKRRVDAEVQRIFANEPARHFLLTGLVLSFLGIDADTDLIFDFAPTLRSKFNGDSRSLVTPFFESNTGRFSARSSVLAGHVLNTVVDPNELLEKVCQLCKLSVEKGASQFAGRRFFQIPTELTRFANQIALFPAPSNQGCIIQFFEFAKTFNRLNTHVHFWLQYAIARTAMGHFPEASQLFSTTYELAKRQDSYNTSFIDNHYARFLILQAKSLPHSEASIAEVRQAVKLLETQMRKPDENKHYPFKVATLLLDYLSVHHDAMTELDLSQFRAFAKFVLSKVPSLSEHVRSHFSVRDCEKRFTGFLEAV